MPILSQPDLRREVAEGKVSFDPPLADNQWGEASVDLRLGFRFTKLQDFKGMRISIADGLGSLGAAGFWVTRDLKEQDDFGKREVFSLGPGEFVLAMTHERVTIPSDRIALIEGRSTYARVGLSMHQTAPWIQPGWTNSPIVLEIKNHGTLTIDLTPLVDRPCQLTFFELSSPLPPEMLYGARHTDVYQGQDHPLQHKRERP